MDGGVERERERSRGPAGAGESLCVRVCVCVCVSVHSAAVSRDVAVQSNRRRSVNTKFCRQHTRKRKHGEGSVHAHSCFKPAVCKVTCGLHTNQHC